MFALRCAKERRRILRNGVSHVSTASHPVRVSRQKLKDACLSAHVGKVVRKFAGVGQIQRAEGATSCSSLFYSMALMRLCTKAQFFPL